MYSHCVDIISTPFAFELRCYLGTTLDSNALGSSLTKSDLNLKLMVSGPQK